MKQKNPYRKIFRNLISLEEAWKNLVSAVPCEPDKVEQVDLEEALGKVLANSVYASHNVPYFDRCAMDGFAVKASSTFDAIESKPVVTKRIGEINAGGVFEGEIKKSEAVEVATGALVPFGADAVVMVEYTDLAKKSVSIFKPVSVGENIQASGSDIQAGELVLQKKTVLTPKELGLLAALGISKVSIFKAPKICVFASGDEIINLESPIEEGKVHDINSTIIIGTLKEIGLCCEFKGVLNDKYKSLFSALTLALKDYDIIIISGGTSAGVGDILYKVIADIGNPGVIAHGVKLKPGKPMLIGANESKVIFGLPGYPASAASVFTHFIFPYIKKRAGLPKKKTQDDIWVKLTRRVRSESGRVELKPVQLIKQREGIFAYPNRGTSGSITLLTDADGILDIPENVEFLKEGDLVKVRGISKNMTLPDIQITGSHCIALYRLQELIWLLEEKSARIQPVGSTGGIIALLQRECHVASAHLPSYNEFDLEEYYGIFGYYREQGLIIKKENKKMIKSINDLIRKDVKFLNRNPGSGTRILFDQFLQKEGIDPSEIQNYNTQARSHHVAAQMVKSEKVDVSIGLKFVVDTDLDFIPLASEKYNFFVAKESLRHPNINTFINCLQSKRFMQILLDMKGYSPHKTIGQKFKP